MLYYRAASVQLPRCTRRPVTRRRWPGRSGVHGWCSTTGCGHAGGAARPGCRTSRRRTVQAGLTAAKKTPERAWLGEVSAVVLQQALADLNVAYRNFFASVTGKRKGRRWPRPGSGPGRTIGRRSGSPQCPVQGAGQRSAAAAEDRRRARCVVPDAAVRAVVGDNGQGRGRAVLRLVRGETSRRAAPGDRAGGRHRPGTDPLRGALGRHEGHGAEVPAPRGSQAQAEAAGSLPQAEGEQQPEKAGVKVARAHARVADARRELQHKLSTDDPR